MKTSELTGVPLDYWVARAEGVPAEKLHYDSDENRYVIWRSEHDGATYYQCRPYSSVWSWGGPLIDKHPVRITTITPAFYEVVLTAPGPTCFVRADGDTPLQAIYRAVVRAAFGDEVEEVAG